MTTRFGLKSSRGLRAASAGLALASLLAWSTSARAGVIVNDTWQDGTRTDPASPTYSENGVDSDADGDIESAWYISNSASSSVTPGHLSLGNTTSSTSFTTYFTPEATPVTLAKGQTLKVTWVFTPIAAAAQNNTSQNFRLAVVDSPAAARVSSDVGPGSSNYTGYGMFMNMSIGASSVLGNGSPFRLMERTNPGPAGSGALLGTSSDWTALDPAGNGAGNHGYDSGTKYTYVMTLTHNAADGLDITSTMTGGTLNGTGSLTTSFTDPTPDSSTVGGGFTFDTFAIRPSSAATTADSFDTTLFKVETLGVPEPTSLVLMGLGGVGMLLVGRRRK